MHDCKSSLYEKVCDMPPVYPNISSYNLTYTNTYIQNDLFCISRSNEKVCDMPPVWPGPIGCLAMVRESTLLQLFVVLFEFCHKIRNKTWFTCVSIQVLVFQMKKWTFSTPEGRCVPYTYGGCRGTQNLFSRCCTLISSFCDRNVIRGELDAFNFVKRLTYFSILEISNKYD